MTRVQSIALRLLLAVNKQLDGDGYTPSSLCGLSLFLDDYEDREEWERYLNEVISTNEIYFWFEVNEWGKRLTLLKRIADGRSPKELREVLEAMLPEDSGKINVLDKFKLLRMHDRRIIL